MFDPVEVRFSDCVCPGTPHPEGDVAYLRPFLDYAGGADALRAMRAADGDAELFDQLLGPVYLRRGMVGWNRLTEDGKPLPLPADPAELPFGEAYWIVEAADNLYGGSVLAPLAKRLSEFSPTGPTGSSRSTNGRSRSKRPKPSGSSAPSPSAASTNGTD